MFVPLFNHTEDLIAATKTIGTYQQTLRTSTVKHQNLQKWGDNYAYHIGDLSAGVLPGHQESKATNKYTNWAQALFVESLSTKPKLKQEVFFWTTAWKKSDIGHREDFGPTRRTFLE